MATKTYGSHETPKPRDYVAEILELVGVDMPLEITVRDGELVGVTYQTEWQEGSTEPIEVDTGEKDENDAAIMRTDYKENYTKQKLDKDQIKKLDAYLAETVKTD